MARDQRSSLIHLEDAVIVLAAQCDGAKIRDHVGFNKPDARDGARLNALLKNDIPWSPQDLERARDLTSRYAHQAAKALCGHNKKREKIVADIIKKKKLPTRFTVGDEAKEYNYCCRSSGDREVHFWIMTSFPDEGNFIKDLLSLRSLRHGHRTIKVYWRKKERIVINGEATSFKKYAVDFNGTTQPKIIELASKYGFLVDEGIKRSLAEEIDRLRLSPNAAWLFEGIRYKKKGAWVVCDLHVKNQNFINRVKGELTGQYRCDPADDWNWFLELSERNRPLIARCLQDFGFVQSVALEKALSSAL